MSRSAYRYPHGELLYCADHYPGKRAAMDEYKVVKPEALLGQKCSICARDFLTEPAPVAARDRFRETWAAEVESGKALPIAGDLFPPSEGGPTP